MKTLVPDTTNPFYRPNEVSADTLGTISFNPFSIFTSSSRAQMSSSAISAHVVIADPEHSSILSGAERAFGKYTYNVQVEEDVQQVVAVIDRYIPSAYNGIAFNPQRLVIYMARSEGSTLPHYGIIDITRYHSSHAKFGFEYKPTRSADAIRVGASLKKGTVLYDSPAKDEMGNYALGRDINVVYCADPATVEDAIVVSRSILPYFRTKSYQKRTMEVGTDEFPLNLYGDDNNYKVFPDIGEYCSPTGDAYKGLAMAKRRYNTALLPIIMSKKKVRSFDPIGDTPLDGGGSNARVVDVIVYRQNKTNNSLAPKTLVQLDKYADAYEDFCQRILREYNRILAKHNGKVDISDDFDRIIRHAMAITNAPTYDNQNGKVNVELTDGYGRRLDDYTIELVLENVYDTGLGFKLTNMHGHKGIISEVRDPQCMPYDPVTGRRADIIVSPETVTNRMNYGQKYEHELKCCLVDLRDWLIQTTGISPNTPNLKMAVSALSREVQETCFQRIERFFYVVSEAQYQTYLTWNQQERLEDLYHIIKDRMYLYLPPDNPRDLPKVMDALLKEGYLHPLRNMCYYNPYTGKEESLSEPTRIAPVHYFLLDKIGNEGSSAAATANVNPSGIIVPVSSKDKTMTQSSHQATRFPGETEGRYITAATRQGTVAEMLDRSNNPRTLSAVLETIYNAEQPTNIDLLVDRSKIPLGGSRPLQLYRHHLRAQGVEIAYGEYDASQQARAEVDQYGNTNGSLGISEDDDEENIIDEEETPIDDEEEEPIEEESV